MRRKQSTKRISKAIAFTIPLIGLAVISTGASADTKRYGGAVCIPEVGSADSLVTYGGGIVNTSATDTVNVTCAFTRDKAAGLASANAFVWDRSTESSVACTLYVGYFTSSGQDWNIDLDGSSGSSVNAQALNYGAISEPAGSSESVLWALCGIPRQQPGGDPSGIAAFKIVED